MSTVPHASFSGSFAPDREHSDPPGASLARALETRLRSSFGSVRSLDNWRDVGWFVEVELNGKSFEVDVAQFPSKGHWLLAVAPMRQPGFLARLLGKKPFPCAAELKTISIEVHEVLRTFSGISNIRWMFGGPPGKVPSVETPSQLSWRAAL
jgi:hypothetical protein